MNVVVAGGAHPATAPGGVLSDSARARIARSVPAETRRAYKGDLDRFASWCADHGLQTLPASPDTLASYTASLADAGKAPSTIDRALAAILTAHKATGLPRPDTTAARRVIKTAQRDADLAGRRVGKATASTTKTLRAMVATCDTSTLIGIRDRAVLVLGFATACRRSELVQLDVGDLTAVDEGLLVWVRASKTGKNREVAVTYGSRADTCPVRTVQAWIDQAGIADGPVFRRIDKHGTLGRTPHGYGASDGRLTGQAVAIIVNRAARRAGLDGDWSGHSLRRGFATEARRAGHDLIAIGRHGGWQDGSRALLGYLEEGDRWTENPLLGIGL